MSDLQLVSDLISFFVLRFVLICFLYSDTSLVTIRDIEAGEMISNDYALTEHLIGFFPGFNCNCKSPHCRDEISVNDWRNPELQNRYRGYFTSGVEALISASTSNYMSQLQADNFQFREMRIGIEIRNHPVPEIGRGLFATEFIAKNSIICVDLNLGKQISVSDVLANRDESIRDFYIRFGYQTGRKEFTIPDCEFSNLQKNNFKFEEIDAGFFMNHSCDPTCISFCNGLFYIAFRDIYPGEEITYDYANSETAFDRIPDCKCNSSRCRKSITGQVRKKKKKKKKKREKKKVRILKSDF